ncbi:MAG: exodeoxyribonuclease VII small subunit [Myxococcales bacterium]|nr:exodeoxyribonuclease VII small subunit [Myxococcales bacterium]
MARAKKTAKRSGREAADEPPTAPLDEVLRQLEGVVHELEGGELPLEVALERFEIGVRLARQGGKLLDGIEERVEVLLADRDEAVPFADADADDEGDEDDD